MGMSTHVVAYFEDNEDFRRKADAFAACVAAGVEPPQSLEAYDPGEIGDDAPGPLADLPALGAVKKHRRDGEEGYEIDISKLPEGVRYVRFYNSW